MTDIDRELSALTGKLKEYRVDDHGLSFSDRTLKLNNEEDAEVVTKEIDACEKLEFLNLDGNTVGIEAAKKIGESLSKHGEFKRAIWKNMFTGRTKQEIPPALEHLGCAVIKAKASLVELDLSDNAFGPIGVQGLEKLIHSSSFHTLQELRLNNNGLGITGGKLLAKSLQKCYESSGKKFALRVFQAGRNRLENPGAEALARVFKMIGTLIEVSMPQNGIYSTGITALSDAFKSNPHLKIINLNDNTVQPSGAKAIAAALPALQNLEILNLGDCLLKTEGVISIAKAIAAKHTHLKTLILEHNEINKDGGMEVALALKNKNNLHVVDLNGNHFGEGVNELIAEFKKNNKFDALHSFSEDEGSEEDSEDAESDGEGTLEEDEEDSSEESDETEVLSKLADTSLRKVTVSEFLNVPSSNNFFDLGADKFELFRNYLETSEEEEFIKNALTVLLTVSNLCENNQETLQKQARACTLQLYQYLFDWGVKNDRLSLVTNAVLVQLRLIKAEEKSSLIDCNLNTCINALQMAMNHNDIIPKSSRDMITIFLVKRNEK